MNSQIDVRDVLPAISAPTLVLYRRDARFGHGAAAWREAGEDPITPRGEAEYLAEHIPGARLVELPGGDHLPWVGEHRRGARRGRGVPHRRPHAPEPDRVLATILFTDIVGSTALAARLGDRDGATSWSATTRSCGASSSGSAARSSTPPATASSPRSTARRAASAAPQAIAESVSALGLSIRAGLHTGECEVIDGKLAGIAVHIAARIAALAEPDEVLVSNTVKDLVVGSRDRPSPTAVPTS